MTQYVKLNLITGDVYTQVRCRFMETQYECAIAEWGVFDLTAGETIAIGTTVFVSTGQLGGTKGRVYNITSALLASAYAFSVGFAVTAGTAGNSMRVRAAGIMTGLSGLVAGEVYYATNAGALTLFPPSAGNSLIVGVAISTTTLLMSQHRFGTVLSSNPISSSVTFGYNFGGLDAGSVRHIVANRLSFATGVNAARTAADVPVTAWNHSAFTSTGVYGYIHGGELGGVASAAAYRFTISSETWAAHTAANLSSVRQSGPVSQSDGATYGYTSGGLTGAAAATVTAVADRLTFSTSVSAANAGSNQVVARWYAGYGNDPAVGGYCYIFGGYDAGVSALLSSERLTISTSTNAAFTTANLSTQQVRMFSFGDRLSYLWLSGGDFDPGTGQRLTLSTGTMTSRSAVNFPARQYAGGSLSDAAVYGYAMGGTSTGGIIITRAYQLTFSTETMAAATTADYSTALSGMRGFADAGVS